MESGDGSIVVNRSRLLNYWRATHLFAFRNPPTNAPVTALRSLTDLFPVDVNIALLRESVQLLAMDSYRNNLRRVVYTNAASTSTSF